MRNARLDEAQAGIKIVCMCDVLKEKGCKLRRVLAKPSTRRSLYNMLAVCAHCHVMDL